MRLYKLFISSLVLCCLSIAYCQAQKLNIHLKKELDSIGLLDQEYRAIIEDQSNINVDSMALAYHIPTDSLQNHLIKLQEINDQNNLHSVEQIFKQFGYPGKNLVGTPTNEVCYYVIQHSSKIEKYFPLIKEAGKQHQIDYTLVAMMEDRLLVNQKKPQIYGTQVWGNSQYDSLTKTNKIVWFFNPVANPETINERRKKAGFKESIEEYAKSYGIKFIMKKPWWQ